MQDVIPSREARGIGYWRKAVIRGVLGRFGHLKHITHGMLAPEVYRLIYREVRKAEELDFVEVGGALGSASIAIAWAMAERRMQSSLVVVEKLEGGSRSRVGDRQANLTALESNLDRFGVRDRIRLFTDGLTFDNADALLSMVSTDRIGGMMLDADGQLHRDFWMLGPRLAPGGPIIIDDYEDVAKYKHRLTKRLVDLLIEWGLLDAREVVGKTLFGRFPVDADMSRFDLVRCHEVACEVGREFGRPEPVGAMVPPAAR